MVGLIIVIRRTAVSSVTRVRVVEDASTLC